MRRRDALPPWRAFSGAACALLVLHALFAFEGAWPGPGLQVAVRPSLELCALLAAVAAWAGWRRPSGPAIGRLAGMLACATVMLAVLRTADQLAPALFGRPLNLAWDARHAWKVSTLAASTAPAWLLAAAAAVALGAVVAVHACSRRAFAALAGACSRSMVGRRALLAVAASPLVLAGALGVRGVDSYGFFAAPVLPGLARQAVMLQAAWSPDAAAARLPQGPAFEGTAGRLRGADLLVVFVESYGATTLDDPAQSAALAPHRHALARLLRDGDRHVVSARVRSPTFGGGSWLAHASLLAGADTTDPLRYDVLLTTRRPTLVSHLAANGYRTVGWMPGLQRPWPEGRFYGFDRVADADTIGYRGPAFGFWRIPDQAAMALLHAQELGASPRAPVFAVFPTLDSHAPFVPLAPLQADWKRLLRQDAYDAADPARSTAPAAQSPWQASWPTAWQAPIGAYLRSIAHTLAWLGAYLRDLAPADMLVVVIGDHQPLALVSGQGASWDVPVHVIGRDRALLARFEAAGFAAGLTPPVAPLGPMHALTALLVSVLDDRTDGPARSDDAEKAPYRSGSQRAWMSPDGASGSSAISQPRMPAASRPPG